MGQATTIERGRAPLSEDEARRLRDWIDCEGEPSVLQAAGLSRLALARCVASLSVLAGTRAQARSALARRGA